MTERPYDVFPVKKRRLPSDPFYVGNEDALDIWFENTICGISRVWRYWRRSRLVKKLTDGEIDLTAQWFVHSNGRIDSYAHSGPNGMNVVDDDNSYEMHRDAAGLPIEDAVRILFEQAAIKLRDKPEPKQLYDNPAIFVDKRTIDEFCTALDRHDVPYHIHQ